MKHLRMSWATRADWFSSDGREQRIQDYVILANRLAWKRQGSFFAAAMLAAVYFDPVSILTYYAVVVLTEFLDALHARQSQAWDGQDPVVGRQILKRIVLNTALSAIAIVAFVVNIAVQETSAGHFMPLFFLFSASIFAAMYNSQIIGILLLRLAIYSCAFLYIALLDVLRYLPPLSSPIWMEFFTILFVIYFIGDISLKFYLSYQQSLKQMRRIKEDNARIKDALEVKSQFLATVSHELRTPLTSIMGSLELIKSEKMGVLPAGLKPVFGIAARNSQRLSTLVEDLLDLQKIEAGEMDFDFEAIDVNDLVTEAVDSISGYASKLGIEVAVASSVKNSKHGRPQSPDPSNEQFTFQRSEVFRRRCRGAGEHGKNRDPHPDFGPRRRRRHSGECQRKSVRKIQPSGFVGYPQGRRNRPWPQHYQVDCRRAQWQH